MFIGRWQPPHNGHKWLIDNELGKGNNVLIAIRDVEPDESNPMTAEQVKGLLDTLYAGNENVATIIIPDIESVNYGRGVGYKVNEYIPNAEVASISATEIRNQIENCKDDWRSMVDQKIQYAVFRLLRKK